MGSKDGVLFQVFWLAGTILPSTLQEGMSTENGQKNVGVTREYQAAGNSMKCEPAFSLHHS